MTTKAIVPFSEGGFNLPSVFGTPLDSDFDTLGAGISAGFAVLSFRGKVWRVRHGGAENMIREPDGEPRRKLRSIIVGASRNVSKTYYAGAYTPGATEAPDCFSTDGVTPDAAVESPQSNACATCPMNQFGSRMTDAGKKAKACQDNRRLAIVPADDIENKALGGPMMLRVPPASLQSLQQMGEVLRKARVPYYGAIVDIGFDPESEFPQLTFKPVGVIQSNELGQLVQEQRDSAVTESILYGAAGNSDFAGLPTANPTQKAAEEPKPAARRGRPRTPPAAEPDNTPENTSTAAGNAEAAPLDDLDPGPQTTAAKAAPKSEPVLVPEVLDSELGSLLDGLD